MHFQFFTKLCPRIGRLQHQALQVLMLTGKGICEHNWKQRGLDSPSPLGVFSFHLLNEYNTGSAHRNNCFIWDLIEYQHLSSCFFLTFVFCILVHE